MAENVKQAKTVKEQLFHIVKKNAMPLWQRILIKAGGLLLGFLISGLLVTALTGQSPLRLYKSLFEGNFGQEIRVWKMLQETALLLGIGLALLPAFKMKFWNLGADGQVLMSALVTAGLMYKLGPKMDSAIVNILMIVCSIATGIIWAVIPALFKAKWKTNETLFTLMMNYIATGITAYMISIWATNGSATMGTIKYAWLPEFVDRSFLTIVIVAVLTVLMFVYLKFSKHGYELSVVGESENTARYVGINVKKVVIRTLVLSGAICGIMGLLLAGSINHTISKTLVDSRGFTAVLVTWLADFNPFYMVFTAFLISFLKSGSSNVVTDFALNNSAIASIITGIVIFCVIGCEFFIRYSVKFANKKKEGK